MSLYTLIIVTFIIFMAINVIIGLRGRKHASTTKEFLTASGQSGIWFVIASAVGASIGSGVVIGTTQYAVKLGVAGAWYAIACGLACIVFALIMSRFVYRNKLVSFSDYFTLIFLIQQKSIPPSSNRRRLHLTAALHRSKRQALR